MKKVLLGVILLFSTLSFSQITKVEEEVKPLVETRVGPMGSFWIGAKIYDDHVNVTFADANYTTINVYRSFSISNEDFESLYTLLSKDDNKEGDFYQIKCHETNKVLYIKYSKSLGVIYPLIILLEGGNRDSRVCTLSKSQIRKLFNKTK